MRLPLAGTRVLDLSRVFAMPYAAAFLADLGAEVIKIEAPTQVDTTRPQGPFPGNLIPPNGSVQGGTFNTLNRNKLSITLDLRQPEAAEVFKALVLVSDVVIENFTPRVLRRFELDYPHLRALKPDIIMVSNTGYGHLGPWASYGAMAASLEPMHGTSAFMGYGENSPSKVGNSYTDFVSTWTALFAMLSALLYRQRTGKGVWVDLAMYQAGVSLVGERLLDFQYNGTRQQRIGNAHDTFAPHGTYRCKGLDSWITIAVRTEEEWRRLCEVMGQPDLSRRTEFSSMELRRQNREELEAIISAWTRESEHYALMHQLQEAGIAAGAVLNASELLSDPHFRARGFFELAHNAADPEPLKRPHVGRPWRFGSIQPSINRLGPMLGEHQGYVLGDLLALGDDVRQALEDSGAIISDDAEGPQVREPESLEEQKRSGRIVDYQLDFESRLGLH